MRGGCRIGDRVSCGTLDRVRCWVLLVALAGCERKIGPPVEPPMEAPSASAAKPAEAICRAQPPTTLGGTPGSLSLVVAADRALVLDVVPKAGCPRFALETTRFDAKTTDGPLAVAKGDAGLPEDRLVSPPCPAAGLVGPAVTVHRATSWALDVAGGASVFATMQDGGSKSPVLLEKTTASVSELVMAGGESLVASAYVVGDDLHVARLGSHGLFGEIHVIPHARGAALAFDGDTLFLAYGEGEGRPHAVFAATWPKAAPTPSKAAPLGIRAVATSVAAGMGQVGLAWESVDAKGLHRVHVGASRRSLAAASTLAIELDGDARRPALARGDGPFYVAYWSESGAPTVVGRTVACD